ncbi:MAG: glycosyltransferase family 4 protein, partial [Cyclobacteriaceae bacterium]|nr:glycosyltransferase family 4 protein [Cyclobacteriaceae bacterium]
LIKAYKSLFQKYGKKIRLQLAGEFIGYNENALEFLNGEWRDYYLREKENLKLEMNSFIAEKEQYNIVFEGVLMGDKKDEAFRSADIFVLPSYTEGFSMACLEAMAWGLPIVTTPVGALQEVIKPGINGLLTPVGDAGKLAEKLEKLIENEGLRKEMATNNRKEVNECYDIEVIARHLIETIAAV